MLAKLESLEKRYMELEEQLAAPDAYENQDRYRKLAKAHADLREVVTLFRHYRDLDRQLAENRELLNDTDADMREMAQEEIRHIEEELPEVEQRLKVLLLPPDPLDEKNIVLEIRAGTGGEEAALFAGDLFRMYCRYAEIMGWKVEIIDESPTKSSRLFPATACTVISNMNPARTACSACLRRNLRGVFIPLPLLWP